MTGTDNPAWRQPLARIFKDYVSDRGLEWAAGFMATISEADPAYGLTVRETLAAALRAAQAGDERVTGCVGLAPAAEAYTLYDACDRIEELGQLFEKACTA